MLGQFSASGAAKVLDFLTGRALAWTTTQNTFIALLTSPTSDSVLGDEAAGYTRKAITWKNNTVFVNSYKTSNKFAITFGPFTVDPLPITHYAVMRVSSGGTADDMLMWWDLDDPVPITEGEIMEFPIDFVNILLT